jgi:hypothetical protein
MLTVTYVNTEKQRKPSLQEIYSKDVLNALQSVMRADPNNKQTYPDSLKDLATIMRSTETLYTYLALYYYDSDEAQSIRKIRNLLHECAERIEEAQKSQLHIS